MVDLALVKGLFANYESFYRTYHCQDIECMVEENNYLKWVTKEPQRKEKVKDKEIVGLKFIMANLDQGIFQTSNKIKRENKLS